MHYPFEKSGLAFPIWSYLSCYPARFMASPRVRLEVGRKVITRGVARRRDEWEVLIRDHMKATSRGKSMSATRKPSRATPT
jgi:hypothetical protein